MDKENNQVDNELNNTDIKKEFNQNNHNSTEKIKCEKCGNLYKITDRCCLNCGAINLKNPKNDSIIKLINNENKKNKKITITTGIGNKMGNRRYFVIFNIIIYVILFSLLIVVPIFNLDKINITNLLKSNIFVNCFILGLFELLFLSVQIIFMKTNHKWWTSLIPIYNLYVFSDIVFNKGILFLISFIPGIGLIFILVELYILGKKFNKNPILFMLFPYIYFPIVAFSGSLYNGIFYIDTNEADSMEKSYSTYKNFFKITIVIFLIGLIFSFYKCFILNKIYYDVMEKYLIYSFDKKIDNLDLLIDNEKYKCKNNETNEEIRIINDGNYYFYENDFVKPSFLYSGKGIIKLNISNGNRTYYISYSDDNFSVWEGLYKSYIINRTTNKIDINEPDGIICSIVK